VEATIYEQHLFRQYYKTTLERGACCIEFGGIRKTTPEGLIFGDGS
jgi:hypothetical protein